LSKKKATSSDVAKRAGVSQATVSMVLNKKYNVSFSRETVEKVEQAARELGYHLPGRKNRKESRKDHQHRLLPLPGNHERCSTFRLFYCKGRSFNDVQGTGCRVGKE
jgi:transcriptional regulator with XRE-family HTH domain